MNPNCPVCDNTIEFTADAIKGELLECPDCGTELEITRIDPPTIQEAPQEEEDWGE